MLAVASDDVDRAKNSLADRRSNNKNMELQAKIAAKAKSRKKAKRAAKSRKKNRK